MAEDRRLWQRQPGETEKEFLAFEIFRQLGPGRTVDGAYRAYWLRPGNRRKHDALARDKTPHYFSRWTTDQHWWERARAWDDEVAAAARKEEMERGLERRRREAAEDERQRELTIQRGRAAGVAAGQILHRLLESIQSGDLKDVTARDLLPHLQRVEAVLEGARKLERVERGEPTEIRREIGDVEARGLAELVRDFVPQERWEEAALALDRILNGTGNDASA
jgi:hypothetical protein